jgi:hypothetical protein
MTDTATSMLRRRAFQRLGSRLALFALLLQAVLSFGHYHADPTVGDGARTCVGTPCSSASSDVGDPANHPDCPICATMALAGSLLLPAPTLLPRPTSAGVDTSLLGSDYGLAPTPYRLFETRAPPAG